MMRHRFVSLAVACAATVFGAAGAQISMPDLSYGRWGIDLDGADMAISPGDDFFQHANGRWLAGATIPPDKSRVTLRALMTDRTEGRLHSLLEEAAQRASQQPDDIEGKVGAFYKAFMNEEAIEALGANPVLSLVSQIRDTPDREALGTMMGRARYDFVTSVFDLSIYEDVKDPSQYALYINPDGLGLPDRDYYLTSEFSNVKDAYQAYLAQLLESIGWSDPAERAKQIVAMETRIAEVHWTRAEAREIDKSYNPMSIPELERLAPGFPWRTYFAEAKLAKIQRVIVGEKGAFPGIANVFATTPVDTLKAWQAARAVNKAAPYLSKKFVNAHFEIFEQTILAQQRQPVRWKRGVLSVSGDLDGNSDPFGHLGWAVGELYASRHFSATTKEQTEALVASLVRAFHLRLEKNGWMSEAAKAEALSKLDSLIVLIGRPSNPQRDYSQLVVRDDDLIGNVSRAAGNDWDFLVNRIGKPVDRNEWSFRPQVNNAANTFSLRNLTFPAALFQAPMYDPNADPAVNYGAFGAYAGHEISHTFDDQGRKIDAHGRLRDWWTDDEVRLFTTRSEELGKQYSSFEPLPGLHVNGRLTMGENIADLGGVTVALDAYHASLNGRPAPVIDGLTGDQRFFLGWAQAWRGKLSDEALRNQVTTDPHAPRAYRVNGVVRNIDAWYAAFNVTSDSKLYIKPENRVRIW